MAQRLLIGIEPTRHCNLRCVHCLRADTQTAEEIPIDLLEHILDQARAYGEVYISLTGGEPTLHRRFFDILDLLRRHRFKANMATNGQNFLHLITGLEAFRDVLPCVSFSLDGASEATHDAIRGPGTYRRVLFAMATARHRGFGVTAQLAINRLNRPELEELPGLCQSLGVQALYVCHTQPTRDLYAKAWQLAPEEWIQVEKEVREIARATDGVKPQISIGGHGPGLAAPCLALAHRSLNIDFRGRLTFCCQLSGAGGPGLEADVVADLRQTSLRDAHLRLFDLVTEVARERLTRIIAGEVRGPAAFHCWHCLRRFGKLDWMREFPQDPWASADPDLVAMPALSRA